MAATYKDIMVMAKTLMAVHKEISKVWLRFKKTSIPNVTGFWKPTEMSHLDYSIYWPS